MIHARRIGSRTYYVDGYGIRGTVSDITRWARICHPGLTLIIHR